MDRTESAWDEAERAQRAEDEHRRRRANGQAPHEDDAPPEWADPEPLREGDETAPFPLDALPTAVREAAEEYQAYGMQPLPIVVCSALAEMSGAVQGLVNVRRDRHLCGPVSVNTVVIAESGERKSASDRAFSAGSEGWARAEAARLAPLLAQAREAREGHLAEKQGLLAAIREAWTKGERAQSSDTKINASADIDKLKCQLKEHAAKLPPLPPVPTPRIENGTAEGIANALRSAWPSISWASNEGGNVTGGHGFRDDARERTMAFLNSRWDGEAIDRARAAEDYTKVYGRRLTVSLMLQPAVFRSFVAAGDGIARGMGLLSRMLVVWPQSTMGTRIREDDDEAPELRALATFTARAKELRSKKLPMSFDMSTMKVETDENSNPVSDPLELSPTELRLDTGARRRWIEYLNECERELVPEGELVDVRDVASKSAENACRLAAIFHTWQHGPSGEINGDDMYSRRRGGALVPLRGVARAFGQR